MMIAMPSPLAPSVKKKKVSENVEDGSVNSIYVTFQDKLFYKIRIIRCFNFTIQSTDLRAIFFINFYHLLRIKRRNTRRNHYRRNGEFETFMTQTNSLSLSNKLLSKKTHVTETLRVNTKSLPQQITPLIAKDVARILCRGSAVYSEQTHSQTDYMQFITQ